MLFILNALSVQSTWFAHLYTPSFLAYLCIVGRTVYTVHAVYVGRAIHAVLAVHAVHACMQSHVFNLPIASWTDGQYELLALGVG